MKFKFILNRLALLTCEKGQSHALWSETSPFGTFNIPHLTKAFSGKHVHLEIESLGKWDPILKGFKLFLIGPENPKNLLEAKPSSDHSESSFKPASQGSSQVMAVHTAQGPYERKTLEFSSNSYGKVGDSAEEKFKTGFGNKLLPKKLQVGDSIQVSIIGGTEALPHIDMEVISCSGWRKTLYSNLTGKNSHIAALTGIYFFESSFWIEKSSNWFGKTSDKIWRNSVAFAKVN